MDLHDVRSLPSLIVPELLKALRHLSDEGTAKLSAIRALSVLASFSKKHEVGDLDLSLDLDHEQGLADSGVLESDLQDLFTCAGEAARAAGTCICIFFDDMQHLDRDDLAALILAIHYSSQRRLPVVFVGTGPPDLRVLFGEIRD